MEFGTGPRRAAAPRTRFAKSTRYRLSSKQCNRYNGLSHLSHMKRACHQRQAGAGRCTAFRVSATCFSGSDPSCTNTTLSSWSITQEMRLAMPGDARRRTTQVPDDSDSCALTGERVLLARRSRSIRWLPKSRRYGWLLACWLTAELAGGRALRFMQFLAENFAQYCDGQRTITPGLAAFLIQVAA